MGIKDEDMWKQRLKATKDDCDLLVLSMCLPIFLCQIGSNVQAMCWSLEHVYMYI